MPVVDTQTGLLGQALELHPQVAVRPEPFGALAYHYGNRRLVFLKHPDVVRVLDALAAHPTVAAALDACAIESGRHRAFADAIRSLVDAEMVRARAR